LRYLLLRSTHGEIGLYESRSWNEFEYILIEWLIADHSSPG
jgi:hypothetical protein